MPFKHYDCGGNVTTYRGADQYRRINHCLKCNKYWWVSSKQNPRLLASEKARYNRWASAHHRPLRR